MWGRYSFVFFLSLSLLTLSACSGKKKSGPPPVPTYAIGVTVSGLSGTGLVLQNNAGNNLSVSANGGVNFSTGLVSGANYNVTILSQPSTPTQTCTVSNGSGTVASANITSVTVSCVTNSYSVGGTVSGLSGSGLVLQNNGAGNLAISANGSYTIAASALSGTAYNVSVLTQPSTPTQTCTVSNATGTLGGANVTNINVTCVTNTYTISGSVSGLSGTGMTLQNNGGNNLVINTNGNFTFSTSVASGASYVVTVNVQPSAPAQTCSVTNGTGTVTNANVSNVTLTCSPWTKQLGSSVIDAGRAVTADASGNVIVAGYTFGNFDGNVSNGGYNAVIVKYAANANKSWSLQFGSSTEDQLNGVAVDASGNIYVAGYTNGTLAVEGNAGSYDMFVAKYNAAGTRQWIHQLGTSVSEKANAIAVDTSGNVYVAGWTLGGLDGNTNAGFRDVFLTKYNTSGIKQWTQQLGSTGNEEANGVTIDASGNIIVTGYTDGILNVAPNAGQSDLFVAKYNSSGVNQWTRQLGSSGVDVGRGVVTDSTGDVYVAGYTGGSLDGNTSAGATDAFITKYLADGTKQWTKQFGSSGLNNDDDIFAITIDTSNNIYVTGYTQGGLSGNNAKPGTADVFVAKYNIGGTQQWISQFGTTGADTGLGIVADGSGNIFVVGSTDGNLDGNINAGLDDIFLVKYNASGVKQ